MLSTRDHIQNKRYRVKVKKRKKYIPYKWKWKKSWRSNIYNIQIDFKTKVIEREKVLSLHNTKGIYPTRGCNTCKNICTQHRST